MHKLLYSSSFPVPFIVGVGRSGTTLLRLMLDSHPEIAIPPETHFIQSLLKPGLNKKSKKVFLNIVKKSLFWKDFGLNENSFTNNIYGIDCFDFSKGLRCFYESYAKKFNKERWGDKTPLYNLFMTGIAEILPEARFLHIIRDGRDVALSYKNLWFGPGRDVSAAAKLWLERIEIARKQASKIKHYKEIRYEDLIMTTSKVLKDVCNFIEISYSNQMENYYSRAKERISELKDRLDSDGSILVKKDKRIEIFSLVSKKPDMSRIERWKREMPIKEQRLFESVAGRLLEDLFYETRYKEEWYTN